MKHQPNKNTSKGDTINFSIEKDIVLCKASVKKSQNPIKGNNQKGKLFWKNIFAVFYQFLKEDKAP